MDMNLLEFYYTGFVIGAPNGFSTMLCDKLFIQVQHVPNTNIWIKIYAKFFNRCIYLT